MSEYQFYEFRAIDRALTAKEQKEIGSWSSRTLATDSGFVFSYSCGDFPKDVMSVVERYFDALFYCSNWGDTRLIFKFPKATLDIEKIRQYSVPHVISIKQTGKHVILDICFSDED